MKSMTLMTLTLALCGCSNGESGKTPATQGGTSFNQLAGADCHIRISPGADYTEMEVEYNSTTNASAAGGPEELTAELETGGSNYCVGGVFLASGTPRDLKIQVSTLGAPSSASAELFGSPVTFKMTPEISKLAHPKPVLFGLDLKGTDDFDLRIHYAGVLMIVECEKLPPSATSCP